MKGARYPVPRAPHPERRGWIERVLLAARPVVPKLASALWRLPAGSRARRWLLKRIFSLGFAAIERQDYDVIELGIAPDYSVEAFEGVAGLDFGGAADGAEGLRRTYSAWVEAWGEVVFDDLDLFDFGDRIVVAHTQRVLGSSSGVAVSRRAWWGYRMQHGQIQRQYLCATRETAFGLLGLDSPI